MAGSGRRFKVSEYLSKRQIVSCCYLASKRDEQAECVDRSCVVPRGEPSHICRVVMNDITLVSKVIRCDMTTKDHHLSNQDLWDVKFKKRTSFKHSRFYF